MAWKTVCVYIDTETGEIMPPMANIRQIKRDYDIKKGSVNSDWIKLIKTINYECRKKRQLELFS